MALGPQVVDLGGFDLVDDLHQASAVRQVPVVQLHVCVQVWTESGEDREPGKGGAR